MFFSHPAHPVIEGAVLIRYGREDLFESGKGVRSMPVKGFGMPARVLSRSDDDAREGCFKYCSLFLALHFGPYRPYLH